MAEYGSKYTCFHLQVTFVKKGITYDRCVVEVVMSLETDHLGFNSAISLQQNQYKLHIYFRRLNFLCVK